MNNNPALRHLYIKAGIFSALVALVTGLKVDYAWGAAYAHAALAGWVNWILLGAVLLAFTEGRTGRALALFGAKFAVLICYVVFVIAPAGIVASAFLCGFFSFLIVAVMDAAGQVLADRVSGDGQGPGNGRPLPRDLKTLITGRATNA